MESGSCMVTAWVCAHGPVALAQSMPPATIEMIGNNPFDIFPPNMTKITKSRVLRSRSNVVPLYDYSPNSRRECFSLSSS